MYVSVPMFLHCGLVVATNLYKYMRTTSVDDSSHKWMHFVYSYTLEGNQRDIIALGTSTEKGTKRDRQWTGPVQIKNEAKPLSNQVIIAKQTNEKESNTHNINREKLAAWHFFVVMLFTKPLHNRNPLFTIYVMNADWEKNKKKRHREQPLPSTKLPKHSFTLTGGHGQFIHLDEPKRRVEFCCLILLFPVFFFKHFMWLVGAPWRTFVIIVAVVDIHINIQHTHSFRMVVWAHCTHAVAGLKHCCWYSHWFIYLLRLFYIAFCSFVVAGWSCMSRWYENMYVYGYKPLEMKLGYAGLCVVSVLGDFVMFVTKWCICGMARFFFRPTLCNRASRKQYTRRARILCDVRLSMWTKQMAQTTYYTQLTHTHNTKKDKWHAVMSFAGALLRMKTEMFNLIIKVLFVVSFYSISRLSSVVCAVLCCVCKSLCVFVWGWGVKRAEHSTSHACTDQQHPVVVSFSVFGRLSRVS